MWAVKTSLGSGGAESHSTVGKWDRERWGWMVGIRIWEMWIENPRDVDGGPGLKGLVPGFGIRVLHRGWGAKAGDWGVWDEVCAPAPKPAALPYKP